jgi:hypothetical protein
VLSCNQNSSIIQASLHFSNNIQGKMERSHVGASSRARTFSMPLSLHIAYSVSLPVVIGTWISILSNSHVTSALRPVSRSKRTTAASGQVVFSTRSFMFSPPCGAKGYPPPWRCHERRQQRSGPTFPSWARSTPATLLLCRFLVNRDEHPTADPGWGTPPNRAAGWLGYSAAVGRPSAHGSPSAPAAPCSLPSGRQQLVGGAEELVADARQRHARPG